MTRRLTVVAHVQVQPSLRPGTFVYCGRPSKWGNPFRLNHQGSNRVEVIQAFRAWWYHEDRRLLRLEALRELPGKILLCYCFPKACHADVIAEFVNTYTEETMP